MAKLVIPSGHEQPIQAMGLVRLHPVDLEMLGEILTRLEPTLRNKPGILSLTEAAMLCMYNKVQHSDAMMLLTLAKESGEPYQFSMSKPQPGQIH